MKLENKGSYKLEIITCNVCGKEVKNYCKCPLCQKLICSDCWHFEEVDDFMENDLFNVYCKICWKVGEGYRSKISEAEDVFLDTKDDLTEEWHIKCKG